MTNIVVLAVLFAAGAVLICTTSVSAEVPVTIRGGPVRCFGCGGPQPIIGHPAPIVPPIIVGPIVGPLSPGPFGPGMGGLGRR